MIATKLWASGVGRSATAAEQAADPVPKTRRARRAEGRPGDRPPPRVVAEEPRDDVGVEPRAGLLRDHVERPPVLARAVVRPARRNGIEGVGHRDDPRPERYLLRAQTVGVPAAVQPLVVVLHHRGDLGVADLGHHPRPIRRVPLHDRELLRREAARLGEYLPRGVHLAHVVDAGRDSYSCHVLARQPHLASDPLRVPRDPPRMTERVRVLRLEHGGQPLEGLAAALAAEPRPVHAGGAPSEQSLRLRQPPLGSHSPQQAPEHQVAEDQVPRVRSPRPERGADGGSRDRQQHGQEHGGEQQPWPPRRLQHRHRQSGKHDHSERRDHSMRKECLRRTSKSGHRDWHRRSRPFPKSQRVVLDRWPGRTVSQQPT